MTETPSLADKVREFDFKLGEDIEKSGVKALSQIDHSRLRDLLP